jgi:phosphate butyryltransferase
MRLQELCVLLPGLNAANAVYKTLTAFADATGAGIIAGSKIPVILTSRADSHESKYLVLKLALCVGSIH